MKSLAQYNWGWDGMFNWFFVGEGGGGTLRISCKKVIIVWAICSNLFMDWIKRNTKK